MTTGGWVFMIASLALVWGVTLWSYWRMFRSAPPDEPHPPPNA